MSAATFDPTSAVPPEFAQLVRDLQHASGAVLRPNALHERPCYGTTIYIANCLLDTRYGLFRAYVFQDLIDKHYIIALAHGDISTAQTLYTRLHSSCVTSETLRGCDCDCVQQLEGAFKVISEKGNGVLFYLLQEGRGVGYVGKARDRMLVQASLDQVSTFAAYAAMGLQKDHRNYENISHICYLLGIKASWIVLTNNPDKVDSLRNQGLVVAGTEALEFEPSPYNLAYLTSKAAGGHILKRPTETDIKRALPPEPVVPFKPHALAAAKRFIYSASYFLPMKPVDNDILLTETEFTALNTSGALERYMAGPAPLILAYRVIRDHRVFVRINPDALAAHRKQQPDDPIFDLITTPYWFRVHVYYDIVTSQDFVVLTHGHPRHHDIPVVRLHSESLFNRFPLRQLTNRDKMKESVKHIVTYGAGAMLLVYNDGRGAGFGAHAADRMMTESNQALSSDEAYRKLGIEYDSRDYDAAFTLLKHHIPNEKIQMVMNSPGSLVMKPEYAESLHRQKFEVDKWIFLDDDSVGE